MRQKPIPRRVIRLYMSTLVRITRSGVDQIPADSPEMAILYQRDDFDAVTDYLCGADLITYFQAAEMAPILSLTDSGATWLERERESDSEHRWDRGLAIAAILISIGSLIVSVIALTR